MKISTIILEDHNGVNERLNVARNELNQMYQEQGADWLVDAILHIEDENVLDDIVAALNVKRTFE